MTGRTISSRRSRDGFDLIVVGAGVVGSAAALQAMQLGLQVALVESQPHRVWQAEVADLRVYALASDNQALLAKLGVWPAMASARAHPYRRMRVWDAAGGGELVFDADALGRQELGHIIENDLLVDRLQAALGREAALHSSSREAALRSYCPDRVVGLNDAGDHVEVRLDSGLTLRGRLLLGADGAHSQTRELAGIASTRHDYGQCGLVAYVRTTQPHQDTAWQRFLPTGPLAFLPCADGRCSIVWTLPDAESQRLRALAPDAFCAELTRAFDARLGEVVEVGERVAFPLRRQIANHYHQGRVLLLGDAAHAVHPLAGQGVNLGLRDVAALADLLQGAIARGVDIGAGHRLARWARERRSETLLAAYAFEGINRVFSNDAVLPTLLRGHLLGLAGRLSPITHVLWKHAAGL